MTCAKPATLDPARLRSLVDRITENGLCTGPDVDPDHWFPEAEPGRNAMTQRRFYEQAAAARCFDCPVQAECLEMTLAEEGSLLLEQGHEPHGIRAGLAPWMRFDLLIASKSAGINTEEAA